MKKSLVAPESALPSPMLSSIGSSRTSALSVPGEAGHQVVNEDRADYIGSHKAVKSYILFISDDQFTIDNLFGLDLS